MKGRRGKKREKDEEEEARRDEEEQRAAAAEEEDEVIAHDNNNNNKSAVVVPSTPSAGLTARSCVVMGWGDSSLGQLGLHQFEPLRPVPVFSDFSDLRTVACGSAHSLAVWGGGANIAAKGNDDSGQAAPVVSGKPAKQKKRKGHEGQKVKPDPGYVEVAAGAQHSLALREDGQAFVWGSGAYGQLGQGAKRNDVGRGIPKGVHVGKRVVQVCCGAYHSGLVCAEGQLYTFGMNCWGQLGFANAEASVECVGVPTEVAALWGVCIVQCAMGDAHSVAVSLTGRVYAWGRNTFGQCGPGEDERMPVTLVKTGAPITAAACGRDHTLLLARHGIFSCGSHRLGQLGVGAGRLGHKCLVPQHILKTVAVAQIACGAEWSAATLAESGQLLVWGDNRRGQLGLPRVQEIVAVPTPVEGITGVVKVSCGSGHGLAMIGGAGTAAVSSAAGYTARSIRMRALSLENVQQLLSNVPPGSDQKRRQSMRSSTGGGPLAGGGAAGGDGALRLMFGSVEALCHCLLNTETGLLNVVVLEQIYAKMRPKQLETTLSCLLARADLGSGVEGAHWLAAMLKHPTPNGSWVAALASLTSRSFNDAAAAPVAQKYFSQLKVEEARQWTQLAQHALTETLQEAQCVTRDALLMIRLLKRLFETRLVAPHKYYNDLVSRHLDVAADYDRWCDWLEQRAALNSNNPDGGDVALLLNDDYKPFSFCANAFLLNPFAKAEVLQEEARIQMDQLYADAVVREMLGRASSPFLDMVVRRDHIIEDSLARIAEIEERNARQFRKRLKVTFENEQGLDEGGVRKEWFLLLVRQLFRAEYGMVKWDDETRMCWFSPSSLENESEFKLCGIVIGLAIYNSTILDVHFPTVIYAYLLNPDYVPTFDDLQQAFPRLASGLKALLEYPGDDIEDVFCLTFSVSTDHFGETITQDLCENGAAKPVTRENRQEYVDLYTRWVLLDSVRAQLTAFVDGFNLTAKRDGFLQHLLPQELERIVCGYPHWNLAELQRVARYEGGYSAETPVIQWFWELVAEFTPEQQHSLLSFATGSDRVPVGGFATMEFIIQRQGEDSEQLPTSHTCFNVLLIPEYATKEKLAKKLQVALAHGEGFGLQ